MELTQVDRDILTALINIYRREDRPVKAEKIAELIDRHPGTVRNRMPSLEALNLVVAGHTRTQRRLQGHKLCL
jgi:transcriptional regulator